MSTHGAMSPGVGFERWLQRLAKLDPNLHQELLAKPATAGLTRGLALEAARPEERPFVLEAIVHKGRPALLVQNEQIIFSGYPRDGGKSNHRATSEGRKRS